MGRNGSPFEGRTDFDLFLSKTQKPRGVKSAGFSPRAAQAAASRSRTTPKASCAALVQNLPGMAYRCLNDPQRTMEFVSAGCRELTGRPRFLEGLIMDITDTRHYLDELVYRATRDTLTGLANRPLLVDRLKRGIAYGRHYQCMVAAPVLNIDKFKYMNESQGKLRGGVPGDDAHPQFHP